MVASTSVSGMTVALLPSVRKMRALERESRATKATWSTMYMNEGAVVEG